jgi:transcriptional regulator with XRE-family HTH domain
MKLKSSLRLSHNLDVLSKATSLRKVATAINVPVSTISAWKNGTAPSGETGFEHLLKLSRYLNTSVDVLLYGDISQRSERESSSQLGLDSFFKRGDSYLEGQFIVDIKIKPLNKNK